MKPIRILILFLFVCPYAWGQANHSSEFFRILKAYDSLLFTVGFNTCDLTQFERLISDNFEFYHDEAGITSSKAAFIEDIRNKICKLKYKPRRQLVEASLKVYPLEKNGVIYGAIQTGEHRFYAVQKEKPEYLTSAATFTHMWLLEKGEWKLSRAFSYDHHLPEVEETIDETLLFKDREETEKWMKQKRIPALGIGYIKEGKIRQVTVYGKNEKGVSYPTNTLFNVASLTKPVTALVALKLVNEGLWSLDEPLHMHWTDPDVANDPRSKKLTTRHILSHQSGFPNWRYKSVDGKLAFEFEPGTKHQYSGEGFEYLRKALEHKFAKSLEQLASELIFQPLKMNHTHFYWDSTVDESKFAKGYRGDGSLHKTYKNTTANAADDLLTTVEDYTRFVQYMMNGAGLKKDLYKEMISEQARLNPSKYWGLGWWVDERVRDGENVLIHGGDDTGVHTIVFILPDSKEALLVFTNCDNGTDIYIPTILHYLGKTGQAIVDIETR